MSSYTGKYCLGESCSISYSPVGCLLAVSAVLLSRLGPSNCSSSNGTLTIAACLKQELIVDANIRRIQNLKPGISLSFFFPTVLFQPPNRLMYTAHVSYTASI